MNEEETKDWFRALNVERVIMLDNRISKLIKTDEDFKKLIGDDKELAKKLIDKIGQEAWTWFCDATNIKKFITIDLKKKSV